MAGMVGMSCMAAVSSMSIMAALRVMCHRCMGRMSFVVYLIDVLLVTGVRLVCPGRLCHLVSLMRFMIV